MLFQDFETLDVFGPVEIMGSLDQEFNRIELCSFSGGLVKSKQGCEVSTRPVEISHHDVLLIPGGKGTRQLVHDLEFIAQLEQLVKKAAFILCVCTGSVLLAKTGILDKKKATTNKQAFSWVQSVNPQVD